MSFEIGFINLHAVIMCDGLIDSCSTLNANTQFVNERARVAELIQALKDIDILIHSSKVVCSGLIRSELRRWQASSHFTVQINQSIAKLMTAVKERIKSLGRQIVSSYDTKIIVKNITESEFAQIQHMISSRSHNLMMYCKCLKEDNIITLPADEW